jgi:hypothetical protein
MQNLSIRYHIFDFNTLTRNVRTKFSDNINNFYIIRFFYSVSGHSDRNFQLHVSGSCSGLVRRKQRWSSRFFIVSKRFSQKMSKI